MIFPPVLTCDFVDQGNRHIKVILCLVNYSVKDLIPTIFVAAKDILFGSASIIEYDMDTQKELSPYLAGVFTASDLHRQGIDSRLAHHVMEQVKNNKIKTLYLYTPDSGAFYVRLS
jgi:hypothetical protein